MYKRFCVVMSILVIGLFASSGLVRAAEEIPGDGELVEYELLDYRILNIDQDPAEEPEEELTTIVFKEGGTGNELTQATKALQYIEVVVSAAMPGGSRVVLYVDNTINEANPKYIGPRLDEDGDPDYHPTPQELAYEHPYTDVDGNAGFLDEHKPLNFETGLIGDQFPEEDPKTVTPIFWQVYRDWQGSPQDPWSEYDYADPYNPDYDREPQYRNPGDWWATMVEKYRLDWDWKIDFNTGHFVIDTEIGDEESNYWVSMKGYRSTCFFDEITSECKLGNYPGARDGEGYRLDTSVQRIAVDEDGNPLSDDWLVSSDSSEVVGYDEDGNPIIGYKLYVYFGANLTDKFAQEYSTSRLILALTDKGGSALIEYVIPAVCVYNEVKDLTATIIPRYNGEADDVLYFCENDPEVTSCNPAGTVRGVIARQYLEVASKTNAYDGRVMAYIDNTHNDANPKYTGRRTVNDPNYAPEEGAEEEYLHPIPDENHSLPADEKNAVDLIGGDYNALNSGLKPASFVRGLVKELYPQFAIPIFWQVYDEAQDPYPVYNNEDPWTPNPYDIGWSHIHDKYSFEWDWQLKYDAQGKPTGHFRVYVPGETGYEATDLITHWMPMKYDRTVLYHTPVDEDIYGEADGWLGSYPGERNTDGIRDSNGVYADGFEALPGKSPVYLYFATNYDGAGPGKYKTSEIIIDFE